MGGAPYIGSEPGGGADIPGISITVTRDRAPRKVTHAIFIIRTIAMATIDISFIQARLPIESEGGRLSSRYFTVCR
jgi:hypothetical protein